MAEILFDEEDDDELWVEDYYDEADDLAEHTMQSPVLINYDSTLDVDLDGEGEDGDEWSLVDGDFFDYEAPNRKRRKLDRTSNGKDALIKKNNQPKAVSLEKLPEQPLGLLISSDEDETFRNRSIVKWRIRAESPKPQVFEHGQQEKVSILKDWKERFKFSPFNHEKSGTSPTNGIQRAVAVVIDNGGRDLTVGSKRKRDSGELTVEATTILTHRSKTQKTTGTPNLRGAGAPEMNGSTPTRRRKMSPSSEPVIEITPKRLSTRHNSSVIQHRDTAKAGQKRKLREEVEEPEPQAKKNKSKAMEDAATNKENTRPKAITVGKRGTIPKLPKLKPSDDAATKKENIRPKATGNAATKEDKRPKATAVSRRSTRRK
ncbi:MAG: hypothetical protein Q9209_002088 [Squamulea sp. 1 TL-2023]